LTNVHIILKTNYTVYTKISYFLNKPSELTGTINELELI